MAQQRSGDSWPPQVIVLVGRKHKGYPELYTPCERKNTGLPKGTRKQGGRVCADCSVQKPIPVSRWLKKLNWADGVQYLLEQAQSLGRIVGFCTNQGWLRDASVSDAKEWFSDEMCLSVRSLVDTEHLTRSVGDGLISNLKSVVQSQDFFSPAYLGIIQHELLDCNRRLSIELCRDGDKPDMALRPGGEYYAFLHSLSSFLYETKQGVAMEEICESIDKAYPEFAANEKRLVFAFLLLREYARRLRAYKGKSAGIKEDRQCLILDFICQAAR